MTETSSRRSTRPVLVGLALVVLVLAVLSGVLFADRGRAASAAPPGCGGSSPRLTVQGTGQATGAPDQLTLVVDVSVTDPSSSRALADDNQKAAAVTSVLLLGGVAQADVQTAGLTIQPSYGVQYGTTVINGYSVDNTVTATIRRLAGAGHLVDAVAGVGGDAVRIESLTFGQADPRVLEDRARTDAVHQAVSHAAAMAAAAGERLGGVCQLTDNTSVVPSGFQPESAAAPSGSPLSSVPLSSGTDQANAQVTMVYALVRPGA